MQRRHRLSVLTAGRDLKPNDPYSDELAQMEGDLERDALRLQEYVDAGDRVATRLRHYGRGRESGVVIDEELYHQVATFRDGTIVRMEYFADWDEALAAAEISD